MGKRYFCDFCQRSFVDDIDSRKKHLNGVSHLRLKKEYYACNRDLSTLIREERAKETCRRFQQTGICPFGLTCNFTHYSTEELSSFEKLVEEQVRKRCEFPDMEEWLRKVSNRNEEIMPVSMSVHEMYQSNSFSVLPSLRPPTLEEMKAAFITEWG